LGWDGLWQACCTRSYRSVGVSHRCGISPGVYLIDMHLISVHLRGVQVIDVHLIGVHLIGVHLIDVYLSRHAY
jgi:hypothetical protein